MTELTTAQAERIPFSPFAKFLLSKKGKEIYVGNRRVSKYVAFRLKERGLIYCDTPLFEVRETEKPGWVDGELVDLKSFNEYLKSL